MTKFDQRTMSLLGAKYIYGVCITDRALTRMRFKHKGTKKHLEHYILQYQQGEANEENIQMCTLNVQYFRIYRLYLNNLL